MKNKKLSTSGNTPEARHDGQEGRSDKFLTSEYRPMIDFFVEGNPVPQGRPRFYRRGNHVGAYDPPKSKAWKATVQSEALRQKCKPLEGALWVVVEFYLKKPKAMKQPTPHTARIDIDNLSKAIFDALNGIAYHDDAQVALLTASKQYADTPGVNIRISKYMG